MQTQQCSFKGISFPTTDTNISLENRIVIYEYPGSNKIASEYLGHGPLRHEITGFYVGENCIQKFNTLLQTIKEGPRGRLRHPHGQEIEVDCLEVSVSTTKDSRNYIEFQLSFVETTDIPYPKVGHNPDILAEDLLERGNLTLLQNLKEEFKGYPKGPSFVKESLEHSVGNIEKTLQEITGENYTKKTRRLFERIRKIQETLASFRGLLTYAEYLKLIKYKDQTLQEREIKTPSRMATVVLRKALEGFVNKISIIESINALLTRRLTHNLPSYNESLQVKQEVLIHINENFIVNKSHELINLGQEMITLIDLLLPYQDIEPWILKKSVAKKNDSSITVVYRTLGSVQREQNFRSLNNFHNPFFVDGEILLEEKLEN